MFINRIRKFSLTKQFLILYLVATILIAATLFVITNISSHNAMMKIGTQNAQAVTGSALTQLTSVIDDIEYTLFSIQNSNELHFLLSDDCPDSVEVQVEKINSILNSYDIFQRRIHKIELYSLTKDNYPSVRSNGENVFRSSDLYNDVWFNSALASGDGTLFSIVDIDGQTYITISRTIVNPNTREPIAIGKAYVNSSVFYALIEDIRIMQSGKMFLTTNSHIINPANDPSISFFINNEDIFARIIPQKIPSSLIHSDGSSYRILCYPIRNIGLYLISFVNTDEFNTLGHSMIISISLASLVIILFVFLLLYLISSSFIKPVRLLSNDMSCFLNSPSSKLPAPDNTSTEIASLYRSYETMRNTITDFIESTQKQARVQRETEFRLLQAQIKPHFLYNTLSSISALADKINAKDIKKLASSLATYFRTSLNNGKELITVREELEQAISYAEIQKIRYRDSFELKISVSDDVMDFSICKLILQPLIENCITHAFKDIDYMGIIEISGKLENNDIVLSVSDNGYGLNYVSTETLNSFAAINSNSDSLPSGHFGIYSIAQRISLYYGNDYGLTYHENELGGITAVIRLSQKAQYNF